jgi:prophage tail gpP-like protein
VKLAILDAEDRERTVFPFWTQYSVTQDVRQYVSKARLTLKPCNTTEARAVLSKLYEGTKVAGFVEGTKVLTGYVEDIETGQDARTKAPTAVVTVADVLGQTVNDALPEGFQIKDLTIRQVYEQLLAPYGIAVVAGNEANRTALSVRRTTGTAATSESNDAEVARLMAEARAEGGSNVPLQEYMEAHPTTTVQRLSETKESRALHPRPDDTVDKFLIRFGRANGMLVWASGDGKAVISTPDWNRRPEFEFIRSTTDRTVREGRILSGKCVLQIGRGHQEIIVLGRCGRRGDSKIRGTARDEVAIAALTALDRKHRVRRVVDNSLRNGEDAQRRAETLLAQEKMAARTWSGAVAGHGVRTVLLAYDQMVHVHDETCVVEGGELLDANLWLAARTFASDKKGLRTEVSCAWPGSWTAETA